LIKIFKKNWYFFVDLDYKRLTNYLEETTTTNKNSIETKTKIYKTKIVKHKKIVLAKRRIVIEKTTIISN